MKVPREKVEALESLLNWAFHLETNALVVGAQDELTIGIHFVTVDRYPHRFPRLHPSSMGFLQQLANGLCYSKVKFQSMIKQTIV